MSSENINPVTLSLSHPATQSPSHLFALAVAGAALLLLGGCTALPLWGAKKPAQTDPAAQDPSHGLSPAPLPGLKPLQPLNGNGISSGASPGSDRIADMNQRLAAMDDDRRALTARILQLEAVLEERDKALASAGREIQAANEEVTRARNDLQQWKQEMMSYRDRLRATEKENLATLQSIVGMMEKRLEHEKTDPGTRPSEQPSAGQPRTKPIGHVSGEIGDTLRKNGDTLLPSEAQGPGEGSKVSPFLREGSKVSPISPSGPSLVPLPPNAAEKRSDESGPVMPSPDTVGPNR